MIVYLVIGTGFDHSHVIAVYARKSDAKAHHARIAAAQKRSRKALSAYYDSDEDEHEGPGGYGLGPLRQAWRAAIAVVESEGALTDDENVKVLAMEVRQ